MAFQKGQSRPNSKLQYLEGIRGLSAFLILFHHFKIFHEESKYSFQYPSFQYKSLLVDGSYQVVVFFFLTGRVLTLSFIQCGKIEKLGVRLASAVFKRTLRLGIPLIGISLLTSLFAFCGLFSQMDSVINAKDAPWFHAPHLFHSFEEFFIYLVAWFTNTPSFVSGRFGQYICAETSWTLPAELTGSFYLFLLTPVMVNIKSAFLRNSLYLAITIIMKLTRSYNLYFHIGLWMADLSVQGAFDAFQKSRRILVVLFAWGIRLGLASMLVYFRVGRSWSYSKYIDRHWTNQMFSHGGEDQYKFYFNGDWISAASLMLLFEVTPLLQRIFSTGLFRFLGEISFSLYLSHGIILMGIVPRFILFIQPDYDPLSAATKKTIVYISFIVFVFLSIILAWICQAMFDAPAITISRGIQEFFFAEGDLVERCKMVINNKMPTLAAFCRKNRIYRKHYVLIHQNSEEPC